jgi:hypothetical protein
VKIGIHYEFTRRGRKETAEVSTEAASETEAKQKFERQFKGRFDKVIGTRKIGKP